jgi:hypothetical protein
VTTVKIHWRDSEPKLMVVSPQLILLPQLLIGTIGGPSAFCIAWIVDRDRGRAAMGSISGDVP